VRAQYSSKGKFRQACANAPSWIIRQSFKTFHKKVEKYGVGSEDEGVHSEDSYGVRRSIVDAKSAKE
jgi:hypothetical protein